MNETIAKEDARRAAAITHLPDSVLTPGCGCWPRPHVVAPINSPHLIERCDECAPDGFSDFDAATVLAGKVGGTVRQEGRETWVERDGRVVMWAVPSDCPPERVAHLIPLDACVCPPDPPMCTGIPGEDVAGVGGACPWCLNGGECAQEDD